MVEPLALSVTEASAAIGVSRQTLYRMIADGEIATVRIRGRQVVRVSEIERFLADNEHRN